MRSSFGLFAAIAYLARSADLYSIPHSLIGNGHVVGRRHRSGVAAAKREARKRRNKR